MAEAGVRAAEGVDEGYVFKGLDGGEAAGAGVDGGGAGEGGSEVLEVAGPGVGGVGIEEAFEAGDQALVAAVALVGFEGSGVEVGYVFRLEVDGAAYGFGSGVDGVEVGGDPVGGDEGVGVGGEDDGVGDGLEAVPGGVHEETAGGADVGFFRGEGAFGEVEIGVVVFDGVDGLGGGVGAVVEEDDDFVEVSNESTTNEKKRHAKTT